jgi:hypothetical protein
LGLRKEKKAGQGREEGFGRFSKQISNNVFNQIYVSNNFGSPIFWVFLVIIQNRKGGDFIIKPYKKNRK